VVGVGHQDREVCVRVTVDVAFDDPAARHGHGPELAGTTEIDICADRGREGVVSENRRVRVDGGQVDLVHSILEIEDRDVFRRHANVLKQHRDRAVGHRAIADAEHLIAEGTPDVAIVDIHLRNGELSNALIDQLHERSIPVVVITGYTAISVSPEKVEAILQKPVSAEKFLEVLSPIVARKKSG